jgi:NAD(P)-dependent dehydrogenase (short-subunit alcohol dehydrogenase family)
MNSKVKKVALITGAGRAMGLGFETAAQLARQGFTVVLTARDATTAQARAKELAARGLDVVGQALDVNDAQSIQHIKTWLLTQHGGLDVLVNNAAKIGPMSGSAATDDLAQSREILESTLMGTWAVTQALLPLLRQSAQGRVVNVSSGAGSHGDPNFGLATGAMSPAYGVSKAALNALTARFAVEEKPNKVLINAVCPGFTATFEGAEQMGARPVADGAASVVWAALLPDDGPTGGFFRDGKVLAW